MGPIMVSCLAWLVAVAGAGWAMLVMLACGMKSAPTFTAGEAGVAAIGPALGLAASAAAAWLWVHEGRWTPAAFLGLPPLALSGFFLVVVGSSFLSRGH